MLNNENVNYWDLVLVSMLAQHIDPCVIWKKKKKQNPKIFSAFFI